jgi:hypothetical protein
VLGTWLQSHLHPLHQWFHNHGELDRVFGGLDLTCILSTWASCTVEEVMWIGTCYHHMVTWIGCHWNLVGERYPQDYYLGMGIKLMPKMVTGNFRTIIFLSLMGKLDIQAKDLNFFFLVCWVGGRGQSDFYLFIVLNVFPSSSQCVPQDVPP